MSTESKLAVAERLVQLRLENNVKQKHLAQAIGLDPSAMNRIEKGDRAVSVAEVIRIADFFGVSTEVILREPESHGLLFRASEQRGEAVAESLELFQAVIRDYFGARAAVS